MEPGQNVTIITITEWRIVERPLPDVNLLWVEAGYRGNDWRCGAVDSQKDVQEVRVMSGEDFPERMLPSAPCSGAVEVPTGREQEALNKLKAIKTRVRELKRARGEIGDALADKRQDAIESELHHLKEEWNRWEEERKEAARERMILLGHEEA
jgi:hypothetical protein